MPPLRSPLAEERALEITERQLELMERQSYALERMADVLEQFTACLMVEAYPGMPVRTSIRTYGRGGG